MRNFFLVRGILVLLTLSFGGLGAQESIVGYPSGPDERLTNGDLCEHGDSHRYPEQIEYCSRSVSSSKKWDIIDQYEALGYEIRRFGRENFKIDHLIPLCAGGSNDESNLWPQHRTVYEQTDKIEEMTCRLMAQGKMTQEEAVALILDTKNNLEKADAVEADLREQLGERVRVEKLSLSYWL